MNLRRIGWVALLGLSFLPAHSLLSAGEPARLGLTTATPIPVNQVADVQRLADAIAAQLNHSGTLKNYRVDIAVRNGTVELNGQVTDQAQREEVLRLVQGVPGVSRVSDRLTLTHRGVKLARMRGEDPPEKLPEPGSGAGAKTPNEPTPPIPGAANNSGGAGGRIPEPTPIFQAPMPSWVAQNPPAMPPYAWSSYAPYNNYSRCAYPQAYPYKSWPFIGPVYPFPKIPLGWRSVKLEWDDGYWWFSRVGCKHDWWRIRYW